MTKAISELERLRRLAGYGSGEFAKTVDCAQETLSRIEAGTQVASSELRRRMVRVLSRRLDRVVFGERP